MPSLPLAGFKKINHRLKLSIMPGIDPRIDSYISKSADFAMPILEHIRNLVHKTCPNVQETMKWSFPHFDYAAGILCSMASFKQHCSFGFWLGSIMSDPHKILTPVGERSGMGHFGQIRSVEDLPSDKIMVQYIKEAMKLAEKGVKLPKKEKSATTEIATSPELISALKKNKKAMMTFEKFSPSHKKEYVEWITEAKTEATREKRIAITLQQLEEGKSKNWKYNS